jgi:hypothetical protein
MKSAIIIFAATLPLLVACSNRPEMTKQKTTTTTSSSYSAPAPEPEVIEQKRSTTITVQ